MALAVSMLTGLPLTTAALILLSGLSNKPMRPTELAAFVGIRPATLTRQLKELEAKGLIERTTDGDDGRACILRLTELGNDVLGTVTEMKRSALRGVLEEMSYEDIQKMIHTLERLGGEVFTTWDTATHPRRNLKMTDA
jgi:DNA-binding MarR family transcriptional regulator